MDYDIFNGDADGICSLLQLRLAKPRNAALISGVKRDIQLLEKVAFQPGDTATVLDLSLEKNRAALLVALSKGVSFFYADHHSTGEIPTSPLLNAHINTASNTCTGLIIDHYLEGRYREWAIVAAFGDNMLAAAYEFCRQLRLKPHQVESLRRLGVVMNYNGYGNTEADLYYKPADLFRLAVPHKSPFEFMAEQATVYDTLVKGYNDDMCKALRIEPYKRDVTSTMIMLPNRRWARRVSGVLGNELANRYPKCAHAIITALPNQVDRFQISMRSPKNNPTGAHELARIFGGGGRKVAAGINDINRSELDNFWDEFKARYG